MLFFFKDTATTEIYTLSLHDALPISIRRPVGTDPVKEMAWIPSLSSMAAPTVDPAPMTKIEEHTSELQSQAYLVCRLLLEKKK